MAYPLSAELLKRLRSWGLISGRWQDGQFEVGLFAGQRLQEGHDLGVFFLAEAMTQLQPAHNVHCIFQCPGGAVVKVGIGQLHITQSRHLEFKAVGIYAGNRYPAFRPAVRLVGFMDTHLLERGATHGGP